MKIMIVDDSTFSITMIRDILVHNGYNVVATAGNKEEMLHAFKETTPDLVTMDLTMPDIDGFASIRLLQQLEPAVKVIMISSLKDEELQKKASRLGVLAYLEKPLDGAELLAAIKKITEEASTYQELQRIYFEYFKEAFADVMNKMTRTGVKYMHTTAEKDYSTRPSRGFATVSGIIGGFPGRMVLDMSIETATKIATKVYGRTAKMEDTINMLSEFANIVAGGACSMLNKKNKAFALRLSPPTVFYGDSIFISHVRLESVTASIATEFGEATLNVGFAGSGR